METQPQKENDEHSPLRQPEQNPATAHKTRKRLKKTNEHSGMPDYEVIASWKDEYFTDCPEDFGYEDAAAILQNSAQKLFEILDELPELAVSKVDETCMRNLRGKARWVRMKAHVALLLVHSIKAREKRLMKFGG